MVLRLGLHYFRDEKIKVPVTRRSTVVSSGGGILTDSKPT